ncbi:hypothetical protein PR002_g826 [Phytophthora rubi]|uniref:PiggyBac transposable element-derived protein domain-containing protein n=1 Tax=Phytophthora rubi TaxID=129364 RepID=A0A6A3P297_9STRA|nr:hypothetical protein PR002_g826 [Phytophthora rubi]
MVVDTSKDRDPHRTFMIELAAELISGKWTDAPGDCRMAFDSSFSASGAVGAIESIEHNASEAPETSQKDCVAVASEQALKECNRKRRGCVICRWENRYATEKTDYCDNHNVCLCRVVYLGEAMAFVCPDTTLTCWQKFLMFYFPKSLFSAKGNIRKLADLYKLKRAHNTRVESGLATPNVSS